MKAKKEMFETEEISAVRINKFLAESGVCSRREADKAVEEGKVTIDGKPAVMGSKVIPEQTVTYCGKVISKDSDLVLIAFNKPVGIECTTNTKTPDNVIDFINYNKRIFPIGRLDKESEGLLLLTNDGNIVNKILRSGNSHEKEYAVKVNKEITPEFLRAMSSGVPILDTVTKPCKITQIDKFTFRIILTQGLNRQIRRMCEALNYRVRALTRVRIMNINLGRLKTGCYRNVTPEELETLRSLIEDSSNTPVLYSPEKTGENGYAFEGETDEDTMEQSLISLKEQAKVKWEARKKSFENSFDSDVKNSESGNFHKTNANYKDTKSDSFRKTNANYNNSESNKNKSGKYSNRFNTDNYNHKSSTEKADSKKYKTDLKKTSEDRYNDKRKNSPNNRIDRSSFTSSKSLRAGRPGNYQ